VKSKTWWAQAETLVGLLDMYQLTRDEKYFAAFEQTAEFVFARVSDHEFGDWYPQIKEDGSLDGTYKATEWKDPYHQTRACLEVIKRLDELLKEGT
jgi:mannobiose 2-epimerase